MQILLARAVHYHVVAIAHILGQSDAACLQGRLRDLVQHDRPRARKSGRRLAGALSLQGVAPLVRVSEGLPDDVAERLVATVYDHQEPPFPEALSDISREISWRSSVARGT